VKYEPYPGRYPEFAPRRRRSWLVALPLVFVLVLAAVWSGVWYYASVTAQTMIDGWRTREAERGHVFGCSSQTIGGYPFRIEVGCSDPSAEWRSNGAPVALRAKHFIGVAQVYDPTLVIAEFTGPLFGGRAGEPPEFEINWTRAQASMRGVPSPQRVSTVFDKLALTRTNTSPSDPLAQADHLELHERFVGDAAGDNRAVEIVLRLGAATAPGLHRIAAEPADGEIAAVVSGLKDLSPKPWPALLREMQATGGHIDIKQARLQQGQTIVLGDGSLSLTSRGRLDGQLALTVVGLDRILTALNIDVDRVAAQVVPQSELDKIAPGLDANKISQSLDRILPGLGGAVRNNSGAIAALGMSALGQPAQLEGKPAVRLPLRFSDGAAFLGPIPLGQTGPLF
jgi:hypothetical protein